MLTFEQKIAILDSYPMLERKDVSLGRVNYQYDESVYDKKNVAFHFHPNGNGFVYAGMLPGYETNDKGFVNVRDYSEDELRTVIEQSIRSLSAQPDLPVSPSAAQDGEVWRNAAGETLTMTYEDELWYVWSGRNLEMAFETKEEAEAYMQEEGFNNGL